MLRGTLLLVLMALVPAAAVAELTPYEEAKERLEAGAEPDLRAAIELFRAVIAKQPEFAPAYLGLARAYLQGYLQHDWDESTLGTAHAAARQSLQYDPGYTDAYVWLADTYRRYFNHSAARLVLADGVSANPDDPVILTLLARNYFDTGDCGMARPYLERAIALGPVAATHRFLGWCAFYRRKPAEQQEHFRRYLELEPDNDQGLGGFVWSYTMQGRYEEAIAVAERFVAEKQGLPNYSWIVANAGEVHLFAGNHEKAAAFYEQALELSPLAINQFASRAATTTLGYLYWRAGRKEEAQALFEKTLDRRKRNIEFVAEINGIGIPERWEYAYDIASVHAVRGERDEAYRWLFRAVMAGYPGHQAFTDPLMSGLYEDPAYKLLMQQTQMRIESTWAAAASQPRARENGD